MFEWIRFFVSAALLLCGIVVMCLILWAFFLSCWA